ncbi:MAG: transcriptional regulator [Campylobacterota bacterium]|nr:transcriptional regulator [Campylobacterota bacterium]
MSDFDISNYLDDRETITEYLNEILQDGDMNEILDAIENIAKAKGITSIEKDAKLRFETVINVLKSLDIKLQVG